MMCNQEKFKRMQEVTRARKAKEAWNLLVSRSSGPASSSIPPTPSVGSSIAPTPPPSTTSSAVASPQRDAVGEKRGPDSPVDEVRPQKNPRIESSSNLVDRLQLGVPARRFILPAAFAHGGNMFDESMKVVIPEDDQAIMTDMGPESLKNLIAESSMHSLKLMEIANFLSARERQFVDERVKMEKRMKSIPKSQKKIDAELKKARLNYEELGAAYDAYKDKYQLQTDLTQTLQIKEEEAECLAKEKESLLTRVAELEGQLQKLSIPDEEEKTEDPNEEYANTSRGSLIRQLVDAQNSAIDMATSSFHNVITQVQILNADVELKLEGLDECKEVLDGAIRTPPSAPIEDPNPQ
jgi:hypothetical protein